MRLPTMVRDSIPPSNKALIACCGRTDVGCSAAGFDGPENLFGFLKMALGLQPAR
jgi:hypothetical protein